MAESVKILGISAYYHDSAACLVIDGNIVNAVQEERFTRKKNDASFPENAIRFCLESQGITLSDVDYISYYDKPFITFERLLETYLSYAPLGFRSFVKVMPIWLKEKLFLKRTLKRSLMKLASVPLSQLPPLLFNDHHNSHAASAFYPSPYKKAAVLCLDGVGEWATSTVWLGEENTLIPQWQINFPHSLGLLYSAFTYYTGFKVNSGEYKLMGLAPYGKPKYADLIREKLIDIKQDGSFHLNMAFFNYATGLTMTNKRFAKLFGGPPRKPESTITQKEMDIAASIQQVTEEILLKLGQTLHKELGMDSLCLAGGVALNCVANGRLLREGPFKNIWIQPAAGDAGGAIGSAFAAWHQYLQQPRRLSGTTQDKMNGAYLGPVYPNHEIKKFLDSIDAPYHELPDSQLMPWLAERLSQDKVIGWFSGAMEFGPRALGARSILGNPGSAIMQSTMNLKIKNRESFRPFAPAIKADKLSQWFELEDPSPYMLFVAPVHKNKRRPPEPHQQQLFGIEQLKRSRSEIPAVTHVDYSARVQTVHLESNPRFYALLDAFEQITGCPILINTSFNVRGEPIVCTPKEAYRCFVTTEMDYLVLENLVLYKHQQSQRHAVWKKEFELD